MNKTIFYIPAILFIILYGWLVIIAAGAISPIVFAWIALFLVGGVLLGRGKFWGGFLGMLPGIYLIYMSTKDTGQVINIELPLGIIVVIFYVFCSSFVFWKEKKTTNWF